MSAYVDKRPQPTRPGSRFLVFALAAILAIGGLTTRLFYLQIVRGGAYAALSEGNRTALQAIPSSRGLIFDRAGRPLVTNVPTFVVKIRPVDLPEQRRDEVVARLAALLSMDPADINAAIDGNPGSRFDLVRVASDVPDATARLIAEAGDALPGVEVVIEARRSYPDGTLVSALLGYTGPVSADEIDALKKLGYLPDDLVGKTGLEAYYESALRGQYGMETVERDATGRKLQVLDTVSQAQAGDSLDLTIDVKEQQLAQKALQWGMRTAGLKRGVVIVMNPQTGEILAMVSLPTYDNDKFAAGISATDYAAYIADPTKPLRNHAIADIYPPGSTFKLVTGLAALDEGVTTVSQRWPTYGCYQIPDAPAGQCLFDWNHRGFGPLSIVDAYAKSSDTFFYQMAVGLGVERLGGWAEELGFGAKSGLRLPGEAAGTVISKAWAQAQGRPDVFTGELAMAGIGQNAIAVTPLQLLNAYAAVANGGHLMRPMIVRGETDADGKLTQAYPPEVIRDLAASPEDLQIMRIGAREVITTGHATNIGQLRVPGALSGKTGTAEFGTPTAQGVLPFHSWFVAYLPSAPGATDADLAIVTFTYSAVVRGNVSLEVVKDFLQQYFNLDQDLRREFQVDAN